MPDVYTETTSRGFFSRLFGSVIGVLLGPVVIILAVILLWWNEGRAVEAIVGLNAAATATVELADANPSPASEGKLVHVVGPATATAAISDGDLGVSFPATVAATRKVEMYQWQEKSQSSTSSNVGGSQTTTTTYTYAQAWSENAVDSSSFHHPEGHSNPGMPFHSTTFAASDAKLGGFALDSDTLHKLDLTQAATPDAPGGWTKSGGELYKGDPSAPKTGDMRVSYLVLPSGTTVSVLAQQSHGGFADYTAPNGYTVRLASVGNVPAASLIAAERHSESILTWILRAVGTVGMVIGFAMFLGPIAIVASIIPFLGSFVRGASVFAAMVVGVPLSLVVMALAWIGHRPLIGGGILVLAAVVFYGLWRMHASRAPAPKPA
jgi:Tfp pilus assembly protein PilV